MRSNETLAKKILLGGCHVIAQGRVRAFIDLYHSHQLPFFDMSLLLSVPNKPPSIWAAQAVMAGSLNYYVPIDICNVDAFIMPNNELPAFRKNLSLFSRTWLCSAMKMLTQGDPCDDGQEITFPNRQVA